MKPDEDRVDEYLSGEGDWFEARLIRLIAKADSENLERFRLAFPEQVEAVLDHRKGESRKLVNILL